MSLKLNITSQCCRDCTARMKKLDFAMGRTACLLACCLLLIGQVQESYELVIKSITVPALVREGSVDYIILDCDYEIGNSSTDGLVVKWSNNDVLEYKWHAGRQPEAVDTATHIDVGYKVDDDPNKMYRAMKFNNPNISLTGNYKCDVFNFFEEQIANASMIVYSTEETFDLVSKKRIFDGSEGIEVTCSAQGLYPQPTMEIFVNDELVNGTTKPDITMRDDNKYDIMTRISLRDEDLTPPSFIKCTLGIPKANYRIPQELVYYPGTPTTTPLTTTKLLRTMEIQALDSNEPNTDYGGGGTGSIASYSLIVVATSLAILRTVGG